MMASIRDPQSAIICGTRNDLVMILTIFAAFQKAIIFDASTQSTVTSHATEASIEAPTPNT